jgi:MFS superfamily sulfate permease-like transporter
MITALAMAALDWKELIYGYNNMPLFGRVATTLFVLELALLVLKKQNAAFAIWAVHLVTHPTTAIAWFFPLLAFAVLLDVDRWPYIREKGWHFAIVLAAPIALACTLLAAEKVGILFSGVDGPSSTPNAPLCWFSMPSFAWRWPSSAGLRSEIADSIFSIAWSPPTGLGC